MAFDQITYVVREDAGYVELGGTLTPAPSRNVTIPFSYLDLSAYAQQDYHPVTKINARAGQATFTLRIPIFHSRLIGDNRLFRVIASADPTDLTASTGDVIINDVEGSRGYEIHDRSDGRYYCRGPGGDIILPNGYGGMLRIPQPGPQVYPAPTGLVVDWDGDSYEVGDTATIRFRTADSSRSCTSIRFVVDLDTTPGYWEGVPPIAKHLQTGNNAFRHVWLYQGESEAELSFPVTARGTVGFRILGVSNPRDGLEPVSEHFSLTPPTPVDDDGNALTSDVVVTAMVGPCTGPCPSVSFQTASKDVQENAGTVDLTVTVDPAPSTPFTLDFTLSGTATPGDDYIIAGVTGIPPVKDGSVTVPANATSVTIPVTIVDDPVPDDGETVTVHLLTRGGFLVSSTEDSVTLTIRNHDPVPGAQVGNTLPADHPLVKYASLVTSFYDRITANHQHGDSASGGWNKRFLKAMGHPEYADYPQAAVTVADATRLWNHGGRGANTAWNGTVEAVTYAEQYFAGLATPPDPPTPEPVPLPAVSVTAGSGVTEGTAASFVFTATPAPSAALDVTVAIAATGDYGITAGTRTVTIPTTGSYTLTLATAGDDADEPNGSVTATVNAGAGYTVGTASTGTVAIADDDVPPPANAAPTVANAIPDQAATAGTAFSLQIAANAFTDADGDSLTYSAARSDGSALPSWLVFAPGTRTFSGTPSAGDAGTLTVRVTASDGRGGTAFDDFVLTVSAPTPVPVAVPAVSVTADAASVTEGTAASFTFTATPAPSAPLDVTVAVAATGDFGIAAGDRTVTIPTTGSYTLTLATAGDDADEPDGSVTATLNAGTGYAVGAPSSGTVGITDDDVPAVTVAADAASVTEGTAASFTFTATPAPSAPLDVTVAIAATGDYGVANATQTVTIPTTGSATLTLATTGDGADEPDGSVTATVSAGTGYAVGSPSTGTVSVLDDDVPAITIAAGADVTEGGEATFTLTADPVPHAPLSVKVAVTADGAFGVTAGERTVTMPVSGTATLKVATAGDDADEPHGSVTATLKAGAGYAVDSPSSGTVAVRDDDEPAVAEGPSVLTLVTRDLNGDDPGHVTEGGTAEVEVRLNPAPAKAVSLYYRTLIGTAWTHHDFRLIRPTRMQFRPGETMKVIRVQTVNDAHDEGLEDFSVRVWPASDEVTPKGGVIVTVEITNDDPMPAAYLARFGRTVAQQALDGIAERLSAPRAPGADIALAGHAIGDAAPEGDGADAGVDARTALAMEAMEELARSLAAEGGTEPDGGSVTTRDALLATKFALTAEPDGAGGSLAFWGRASQGAFAGREGTFSLDGEAVTTMLGADHARGRWLLGLALLQTTAEGDYRDTGTGSAACPDGVACDGAVREGDGTMEASLGALVPYASLRVSDRMRLWAALGSGSGDMTLEPATGGTYEAGLDWRMAAVGARGELVSPPADGSGLALAAVTDALWTRTTSDAVDGLAASDSDVTRFRVGLEGSWRVALEGGGTVTPRIGLGARHDGGDAETGAGIELGGGVSWTDPGLGVTLDVSGRTLIAHGADDLEDRGLSVSFAYDPDPSSARGPTISMRQDLGGSATGGVDALFAPDPLAGRTGSNAGTRRTLEAAWGFPVFGGRFTGAPHAGVSDGDGSRDWALGWRLTPEAEGAPDFSFSTKGTRTDDGTGDPVHGVGVEAAIRW